MPEVLDERNGKTNVEKMSIRRRIEFLSSINKPTNIAEIAKERIRRAGAKIGRGDIGFKAFKLAKSNYRQWNVLTEKDNEQKLKDQIKIFVENPLIDNYKEENVVYEVLEKEGFNLSAKVEKVKIEKLNIWKIEDAERKMFVSFAKKITQEQVENLGLQDNSTFVCLDSALDDTTKINLSRNINIKVI